MLHQNKTKPLKRIKPAEQHTQRALQKTVADAHKKNNTWKYVVAQWKASGGQVAIEASGKENVIMTPK